MTIFAQGKDTQKASANFSCTQKKAVNKELKKTEQNRIKQVKYKHVS